MDWKEIAGFIFKLTPKRLLTIFIISAFILFCPAWLKDKYGNVFGVAALATGSALVSEWIVKISSFFSLKTCRFFSVRRAKKYLASLTPEEKYVLWRYVEFDTKVNNFTLSDGVVGKLVKVGILRFSSRGTEFDYPFHIEDWAFDYLKNNPSLLDGHERGKRSIDMRAKSGYPTLFA